MRRFGLSLLGALALLAACDAAPPVPEDQLIEALAEAHLAEVRAARFGLDADSLRHEALAAHGLDTAAFNAATAYYADHPEAYVDLYQQAIDRMSAERAELRRAADSLTRPPADSLADLADLRADSLRAPASTSP